MERVVSDRQVAQIRRNPQTGMSVLQNDRADGGSDLISGNLVDRAGSLAGKRGTSEENGDATGRDNLMQNKGMSSGIVRLPNLQSSDTGRYRGILTRILRSENHMRYLSSALAVFLFVVAPAQAGDAHKHGGLMVKDVWSRATPARNGVAYMAIFNHGGAMDRLVAVESDVAKKVELHTHSMKDGVMRMRRISAIEVNPGEPAVLAPGGNHVMLMGLHKSLKEGQTFTVNLIFEKAGKIAVDVAVYKAGAMGQGSRKEGEHSGGHKHGS